MQTFPYLSEEHEMLRDTIRRFVAERVLSHGDAWEREGFVPRAVLKEMGALGLLGMRYPHEFGGAQLDTLANVVLAEELGRSTYGGFAITVLVHTDMSSPHLHHAGTQEQKQRWMPDIIAGNKICAVAMTEADAGSDLASMRTTARPVAGGYVLNGTKMYITNGVHGDLYFVAAKTGDPGRNRQMSMFVVEKGAPGFRVARALEKHGWLSSDTAELVFEDCFVPADQLLGEPDRGFYALVKNLQNERLVMGAQAIGESTRAIELTLEWVAQRKAFGATLWSNPTLRQRLAMRAAQVEAARILRLSHCMARHPGTRGHQRSEHGEGTVRHPGERGHVRLRPVSRRHGVHA
jgi:acyl-CoA dehydrogenase